MSKLPTLVYQHFPALKYKNYRLYFLGQLISFTGSWLHGVAHGWLVYQLTHSAFWLGTVSAVSALPVLFLSLYGGFLVDRLNRKKLLILTQSAALVLAFMLGILTITHLITLPLLLLITLLSGIANAIDNPVTQAFVVDVVGKEDLPSAVGLNSTMFNTGRVLGPAVAGFLIALVGIGNIFLINAASFLAILVSLYFIQVQTQEVPLNEHPIKALKEGVTYAKGHPVISVLLLTAGVGAIFCFSQATLLPIIAEKVFQQGSMGLGKLLSSAGLGALLSSIIISSQSKRISAFWFILVGNALFISTSFAFTLTTNLQFASFYLFISTFGLSLQFSSIYSSIQKLVKDEFRGRISSMYVLLFIGLSPIGNIFIGSTASVIGPRIAIRICLLITFLYGVILLFYLLSVQKKYRLYKEQVTIQYAFLKGITKILQGES